MCKAHPLWISKGQRVNWGGNGNPLVLLLYMQLSQQVADSPCTVMPTGGNCWTKAKQELLWATWIKSALLKELVSGEFNSLQWFRLRKLNAFFSVFKYNKVSSKCGKNVDIKKPFLRQSPKVYHSYKKKIKKYKFPISLTSHSGAPRADPELAGRTTYPL